MATSKSSKSSQPCDKPTQEASDTQVRKLQLSIDPILSVILVLSFATRCYGIHNPNAVVFDELHYIKFITLYAKRIFFFDPQPPFGKQLLTLVAHLIGFQGDLSYSQIGDTYQPDVPYAALRLVPCIFGSLIAPISYLVSIELGFRQITAGLTALLIIFENSLLTQSRFILLDPILILFSLLSVYCYLKFSKNQSTIWLSLASTCATLAACTKYSGFYSYAFLVALATYSWWNTVDRIDSKKLIYKSLITVSCLFALPIVIYLSIYYAHLSWLTNAGPHDSIMTSAFQASLKNGLASITRGQPLEIVHGSQITLRHTHGRSCWLHSHEHLYPIKYTDGRGSSHQQQVTCYSFKDINNWWIIKRPHIDELVVTEPYDRIRDGDLVQLVHGLTGRTLNSHDVASAMSPYSQEVSCYVDHNISMPAQNVWRVHLMNAKDTGGYWHTINSRLQLIHLNSSLALRYSGRQLPEWGFHQHEIVADKELKNDDTVWNVEEHRHTKSEDQKEREVQLGQAEFVPLNPTSFTFWEKFYELHYKLLIYQHGAMKDHIYACESPLDWVFMSKGTAYWVSSSVDDNAQIFLIGNPSTSYMAVASMGIFALFLVYYILRRRRQIYSDIDEPTWQKIQLQAMVILGGYFAHFAPYFTYESPLFLQHYLNALVFKIMIIGALIEHLHDLPVRAYVPHSLAMLVLAKSFDTYLKLSPLAHGTRLNKEEIEGLRWKDTWQLIMVTL